ncbi:MAG: TlpA disulfide reductase family protein [Acidobacteriota bacterium]
MLAFVLSFSKSPRRAGISSLGQGLRQIAVASCAVLLLGACGGEAVAPADLVGTWRAVLASPGGELPFPLLIDDTSGGLRAVAVNGGEEAPFTAVALDGRRVVLAIDWYDATIEAELVDGDRLEGRWTRASAGGTTSSLPFTATRGSAPRFLPLDAPEAGLEPGAGEAVPKIDGAWAVEFTDEDGTEVARGEMRQQGNEVRGTFLTPTGDYRFLAGTYERGALRLSTFDGSHAFLFHARAQPDGSLVGDFWSRDTYHATWTARRLADGEEILPDAWQQVGLTNDAGRFTFEFPDLDGRRVSLDDPAFDDKVVLVNLFGSWCPNCNDEAPLLAAWHRRYRDQGLEVVGLAYEFSGDPERDRQQVERFAERHAISYPLLLAGTSDKTEAAATLPDLDKVLAYPTTIFVGRDGRVHRIHSGFAGPGTGRHHAELVEELESTIRELLAAPV